MPHAIAGAIIRVDLTRGEVQSEPLEPTHVIKYLGARGYNAKLLWDLVPKDCDPLGPENLLIFGTGTLTATSAPTSGRTTITCKSPATGLYLKTNVGGHWGAELKFAGYDYIIFTGKAPKPVYLAISDDRVELRQAGHLWGLDVRQATKAIEEESDSPQTQVACIGPAGENQVYFASVMFNCYNAAARGGAGAVMGAKNLKAIAVCGQGRITVANPAAFRRHLFKAIDDSYADPGAETSHRYGTSAAVAFINELNLFPSYNFQTGHIDQAEKISGPYLEEAGYLKRRVGCNACIFCCHRYCEVETGPYAGSFGGGPEYETMSALGSGCGTVDVELVIKANELCNIMGMDTISAGGAVQWALECFQRGIIKQEDADGLKLEWGNTDAILGLLGQIARRQRLGEVLADGVKAAAEKIGGGSEKWAIEAKGLEQSRVETRGAFGYALAFAVNPRGPDHLHTELIAEFGVRPAGRKLVEKITGDEAYAFPQTLEQRAELVRWHEDCYAATDSLGFCAFATTSKYGVTPELMAALLSAAIGSNISEEDLMLAGRRIVTLEKCFNVREGALRGDDRLPYRLMQELLPPAQNQSEPQPPVTSQGRPVEIARPINSQEYLDRMLDSYYSLHGWDLISGRPLPETLEMLGLEKISRELIEEGLMP